MNQPITKHTMNRRIAAYGINAELVVLSESSNYEPADETTHNECNHGLSKCVCFNCSDFLTEGIELAVVFEQLLQMPSTTEAGKRLIC